LAGWIYKKQAKQLVRWHREGNHSIGGRIRTLARYKTLTDCESLALEFPLREAQEIIALEAGYASWADLKVAVANEPTPAKPMSPTPRLTRAVPVIFVANVKASAEFFRTRSVSQSTSCMGNVDWEDSSLAIDVARRRGLEVGPSLERRHRRAVDLSPFPSSPQVRELRVHRA
jgi:hypothetical protein